MKKRTITGAAMVFSALFMTAAQAEVAVGGDYFTQVNIWYEKPEKIQSTNFHTGEILPIGTPVKMLKIEGNSIQFRNEKGVNFTLIYNPKHSTGTIKDYLEKMFSEKSILEGKEYKKLSKTEKDNISKGIVAEGMCKSAVLMAYGYPPSHKTKSTDLNTWIYWLSRFKTTEVTFSAEGLVTLVQ
ncbi:MAG: hypothetical protein MUC65_00570 [Pontiellaceae bacterium]|jgi:hypothetical protein|nr:hypothetical protein [Pontiellaceae bacterium]